MPVSLPAGDTDAELRALLTRLKEANATTYAQLAKRAAMSHGTVQNYITKAGHRRNIGMLKCLLTALGASEQQRDRALELHRQALPGGVDPAEAGWSARALAAECTVWAMGEFTVAEASVHTAIGRRDAFPMAQEQVRDMAPPRYVPRAHDAALRRDIADAAAGELRALIIVRGKSSTGKTRSLFEAVQELCPGWTVIRPRSAAALRRLPQSGLFNRRCVLWLNELDSVLRPDGQGLSLDVLRDLYAAATEPVVLVGTIWPEKLSAATDDRHDRTSDTRNMLAEQTRWVVWHDVPRTLTTEAERATARELAGADPRLARALADPDRSGFAQTIAGAHELLDHYRNAPEPARLLLEAAADARRLGHSHALTESLLRATTLVLWREDHGPNTLPADWYEKALGYAIRPLRGDEGVRALIPMDNADSHESDRVGYGLADYLEQHLTSTRRTRPVPDGLWEALRRHTSRAQDLSALAQVAERNSGFEHTEALYREAAAAGDPGALSNLARWLGDRPGREADAEAAYREAAAAGDPGALSNLARWLGDLPGREADAIATAGRQATVVQTGFADLDNLTNGLHPGQLIIIAGSPGIGKSTFALDVVRHAAVKNRQASVIFSLEMSKTQITMRLLSAEAGIRLSHMRAGTMSEQDWQKIVRKMTEISDIPLFIDDSANMTLMEIRSKAHRLKQNQNLKLIVVDYLQLMTTGTQVESRQQEMAELSRQLKLLARELEVPVIAISQLNRGLKERTEKRPMLSDLSEFGSLEEDADMVILVHRPDAWEADDPRAGEADLIVAKHRNGSNATVAVAHQLHYSRFADLIS